MAVISETPRGPEYGAEVFTGIRPTSELTIANYLGSVREIVDLQTDFSPVVFVADVHGLTDQEPSTIAQHRRGVVKDYLALGVDPSKTEIFTQSHLLGQLAAMTLLLSRELTLNELTNVPTLKDKLGDDEDSLSARVMLGLYPILMASDILAQSAHYVPVGKDQLSHIELTRRLAMRFNSRNGEVFPIPEAYLPDPSAEPLKILALKGDGKMSKSKPATAIFLSDEPGVVDAKLRRAQTGPEGEITPHITSLEQIAKGLTPDTGRHQQIDDLLAEHRSGQAVMGTFKRVVVSVINEFLLEYRSADSRIQADPAILDEVIDYGNTRAAARADKTLHAMREVLAL